jgi:ferredoxin--NADP+ reductase
MAEVIEKVALVPNMHLLKVKAPLIAAKVQPGQFVVVRADEFSERIPLTVADWDVGEGSVSCLFMEVGTSTRKLTMLRVGDSLPTFVGPLGQPLELEKFGTVVCAGGCYGIGITYAIARALKALGNRVISMVEARSSFLLYWLDRIQAVSDEVIVTTKDGSLGKKGDIPGYLEKMLAEGRKVDRIIANGCTFMMYEVSRITRPFGVKTIVGLNPIMIDATGMCGACRVVVGGQTKFACVDGPDFDGHQVDWDLLLARRKAYIQQETVSAQR